MPRETAHVKTLPSRTAEIAAGARDTALLNEIERIVMSVEIEITRESSDTEVMRDASVAMQAFNDILRLLRGRRLG